MRPSIVLVLAALLATGSTAAAQRGLQPFRSKAELRVFVAGIGRDLRPRVPAGASPRGFAAPPAGQLLPYEPRVCVSVPTLAASWGTISGRVIHAEKGTPLRGVRVHAPPCHAAGVVTDAEGRYRLPVAPGTYVVTASYYIGHRAEAEYVTVGAGEAATADFEMVQAPIHDPQELPRVAPGAGPSTYDRRAGFDEGGIVKTHGDHLVILRKGSLFTVRIGGGRLRPVSSVSVYGPESDPEDLPWNQTVLVSEDHVVVIGHSEGGTLLRVFGIDAAGRLRDRSTYVLASEDYLAAENSSHLIDGKLVLYTSSHLAVEGGEPAEWVPALWRQRPGGGEADSTRMPGPIRLFRPARPLREQDQPALHVVTTCSLRRNPVTCESTALIAPLTNDFHVSPRAVYVWTTSWPGTGQHAEPVLYRMPLDGSRPSALAVAGWPVGQFSFFESEDRHLHVVVGLPRDTRPVALLRVPLTAFGDGGRAAAAERYRELPGAGGGWFLRTRFVGPYLLYGGPPAEAGPAVHAVRWARSDSPVRRLALAHPVEAIVPMGSDALVAGRDRGKLHFSSVRLAASPELGARLTRSGTPRGTLGDGWSYRADGPGEGVLGLLVRGRGRPGSEHWKKGAASMVFLAHRGAELHELGELAAQPERATDGGCSRQPACESWYDRARPLFVGGRIFALMGDELVEGALEGGRIGQVRSAYLALDSDTPFP